MLFVAQAFSTIIKHGRDKDFFSIVFKSIFSNFNPQKHTHYLGSLQVTLRAHWCCESKHCWGGEHHRKAMWLEKNKTQYMLIRELILLEHQQENARKEDIRMVCNYRSMLKQIYEVLTTSE